MTGHDATGRHTLRELERELHGRNVCVAIAGRQTEIDDWRQQRGFHETRPSQIRQFPTLRRAVRTLQKELHAMDPHAAVPGPG